MRYSSEYLDDLLCRVDIVEVVRSFVPLRTRGQFHQVHIARCPFGRHADETPSFVVHSKYQFYHCFGCGAHGRAIWFLMEHQKMAYTQAVMWLATRYHFYPKEWARKKRQRERREV